MPMKLHRKAPPGIPLYSSGSHRPTRQGAGAWSGVTGIRRFMNIVEESNASGDYIGICCKNKCKLVLCLK